MFQTNLERNIFNILSATLGGRPGQGQGSFIAFQAIGGEVVNCLVNATLRSFTYGHHARVRILPRGSSSDIFCAVEVPSRGLI